MSLTREVLGDRWDGLMSYGINPTALQEDLDAALSRVVEGMRRRPIEPEDPIVEELEGLIRDTIITADVSAA